MYFLTPSWIVGFVFAYCYFMGGRLEAKGGSLETRGGKRSNYGAYWALASIIVSALIIERLHGGVLMVIVGQVALFIAITLWRMKFEK